MDAIRTNAHLCAGELVGELGGEIAPDGPLEMSRLNVLRDIHSHISIQASIMHKIQNSHLCKPLQALRIPSKYP